MGRSTSMASGRPDNKVENITTIDGQNGLVVFAIPNANKPTYKHREEVRRNLTQGYIENGVEMGEIIHFEIPVTDVIYDSTNNRTVVELGSIANNINIVNRPYKVHITLAGVYLGKYNNSPWEGYDFYHGYIYLDGNLSSTITTSSLCTIEILNSPNGKSPYLATQGNMLHTDIIGDISPYNSSDATYIANDGNTATDVTDIPTDTLVWDSNTSTMWKTKVDTIDLTDSTPSVAIEEGDNWTEVKKGYPQELRSLLASGKGTFGSPLLVDDSGNNLIPDGVRTTFKLSKKVVGQSQVLKSTDKGVTWSTESVTFDSVNNTVTFGTAPATGDLIIVSNENMCQPAIPIQSPKPIETVDRNLIASNHHSVYAYNGLTYASSNKIATGSSVESKGVEDIVESCKKTTNFIGWLEVGEKILVTENSSSGTIGFVYERKSTRAYQNWSTYENFSVSSVWNNLGGSIVGTPKHASLTLDNQSITASKALISQTENATQVFTQEISSGWDGTSTFEDDLTTGLTIGTTYKEVTTGGLYVAEADKITVSDTTTWSYPAAYNDSGTFKQLTTGTTTDNSMNTIQTKVLLKASSIKV